MAGSQIPLYIQIQRRIRELIQSGKVRLGGKLPSENELASQFGVSRMTVRHALGVLAEERVINRRQGLGTFVTDRSDVITAQLTFPISLSTQLALAGLAPSSKMLARLVSDKIPERGKKLLQLQPGQNAAYTKRLRLGDNIPLAINHSWLPDHLVPGITERDFIDGSITKTLIEDFRLLPCKGVEWVEPTKASSQEAELLKVQLGTPLLLMTTISYLADDTPVEYSKTLWRGDKLRLQINSRDFEITFR